MDRLTLRNMPTPADRITVEKRGLFLERVIARLQPHRGFTDADLDDAMRAAIGGVMAYRCLPPPWW